MAVTNNPKTNAPVALSTPWPSTMASASQSLADPSAKAIPSTIRPISRVRRSRQIPSRARQPLLPSLVAFSLAAFVVIYFAVFGAGIWYVIKLMGKPPQADESLPEDDPARAAGITPAPAILQGEDRNGL